MTTATITSGKDSWVGSGNPSATHFSAPRLKVDSGAAYAFVHFKSPVPEGATVAPAELSLTVAAGSTGVVTFSAKRVASRIDWSELTYDNMPGVTGTAATVTLTDPAVGDVVTFDVAAHLQAIADGDPNYGWRIESNDTDPIKFYGFDAQDNGPVLEVEWSMKPATPTNLIPNGIVSLAKPFLQFSAPDFTGDDEVNALHIQIDAASSPTADADGTWTSPDFDSGTVSDTVPELDLAVGAARTASVTTTNLSTTITTATATFASADVGASISGSGIPAGATITAVASGTSATISAAATASATVTLTIVRPFAALTDAQTVYWHARWRNQAGVWSDWSDTAVMTRDVKDSLTIDYPAAAPAEVFELRPTFTATFAGTLTAWRIKVTDETNRQQVWAKSGVVQAASPTAISWKMDVDGPPLQDGRTYRVVVDAYDNVDRALSVGDSVHIRATRTFTVNEDAGVTSPTPVSVTQHASLPLAVFEFTRATAPDSFTVYRDDVAVAADIDPDDIHVTGTTYRWTDPAAEPLTEHSYRVRAVVGGQQSAKSAAVVGTVTPLGLWLISQDRTLWVTLARDDITNWSKVDEVALYKVHGREQLVQVRGSLGALGGSFEGSMRDEDGRTVAEYRADLEALRQLDEPVTLVAFDYAALVRLRDVTDAPRPDTTARRIQRRVSFSFVESDR